MNQQREKHMCNTIFRILIVFSCFAVHEQVDVLGQLHRDVILPCAFTLGEDVVIHWYKPNNGKKFLHSYYNNKDQLEKQDEAYRGRTSLFSSEIKNGNASLLLQNIQEADANQYVCYVGTDTNTNEATVKLNVAAFEENSMEYDAQKVWCSAKKATPAGSVTITWNKDKRFVKEDRSVDSSLEINSSSSLKCTIHHSDLNISWTGNWETKAFNVTKESVTLTCDHSTDSHFSITWSRKNNSQQTEIASTNDLYEPLKVADLYKNRVGQTAGKPELILKDLQEEDNGVYQCTIQTQSSTRITVINLSITTVRNDIEHHSDVNNRKHYYIIIAVVLVAVIIIYIFNVRKCVHEEEWESEGDNADTRKSGTES
ncbi:hypothetical protein XELAEV_18012835mg [Xenopus laevis]|uniref:Ig-like domain-containing protein n=1 Tax=Xenopus laevis TaxID=8355 RepID=A0A974DQM4_XENLA|nr:hypothetical protein XELAEV_18012835mg [Xenopus laevis]